MPPAAKIFLLTLVLGLTTCTPSEPPPSQQQVQQAWKQTEQAAQQVHEAERQREQAERLRDVDRVRAMADQAELERQRLSLMAVAVAISLLCTASVCWLGVELRRRRVLQAALHTILESKGAAIRTNSSAPSLPDLPS